MIDWRIAANWFALIFCLAALVFGLLEAAQLIPAAQLDTPYALLYYYQLGCPACDEVEPIIDTLEERYAGCVTVRRLNVQWRRVPNIQGVPTVLLVDKEGKEMARWIGAQPLRVFSATLQSLCRANVEGG